MFIVELSVIKPITAKQIKASTRKLISSLLSPPINHGGDLVRRPDSAPQMEAWDGSRENGLFGSYNIVCSVIYSINAFDCIYIAIFWSDPPFKLFYNLFSHTHTFIHRRQRLPRIPFIIHTHTHTHPHSQTHTWIIGVQYIAKVHVIL